MDGQREFQEYTVEGRALTPAYLRGMMGRPLEPFLNPTVFFDLCKAHGAIVAGGYPLSVVTGTNRLRPWDFVVERLEARGPFHNTDVDIYLPNKNVVAFLAEFHKQVAPITNLDITHSSWYCRSFLRMNKIRRIYRFRLGRGDNQLSFDIMAVRKSRTPQQVVANFDLTFCQVYYDGEKLFATDPDHIRTQRGFLQKDYVKLLFEGNRFLQQRMEKYHRRGFTITPEAASEAVLALRANLQPARCARLDEPGAMDEWLKHQLFYMFLYGPEKYYNEEEYGPREIPSFTLTKTGRWGGGRIRGFRIEIPQSNRGGQGWGNRLSLLPDDGYDSDDYDTFEKLETLGQQKNFPTGAIQGNQKHVYAAIKQLWISYQKWSEQIQIAIREYQERFGGNVDDRVHRYQRTMRPFQLHDFLQQYMETEMPARLAAAEGLQNVERRLTRLGSAALNRPNASVLPTNVMRQIAVFTGNRRGLRGAMGVRNEPLNANLGAINVEGLNRPNPVAPPESNQNVAIRQMRQSLMNLTGQPVVPPPAARRTRKNRKASKRKTRARR